MGAQRHNPKPEQTAEPECVPMQASPINLKYKHFTTTTGEVTVITRVFAEPARCHLCPKCDHDAGYCQVIAPEHVPPWLCGRYRLRG